MEELCVLSFSVLDSVRTYYDESGTDGPLRFVINYSRKTWSQVKMDEPQMTVWMGHLQFSSM